MDSQKKAVLALSNGIVMHGRLAGFPGTTGGELCYNTGMTGYQEILTDPENYGQLIMMTYPHIGNGGTAARDNESDKITAAGLVARAFSREFSNPAADGSLQTMLEEQKITGITGVDTRKLVRHLRENGTLNAVISSEYTDTDELVEMAKNWKTPENPVLEVTRKEAQTLNGAKEYKVAVFDYGIKHSTIESLRSRGCTLRLFPAAAAPEEIEKWEADAYFLSGGPGNANELMPVVAESVSYAKKSGKPVFGISLGHQLLAISEGFKVVKMRAGHRGVNHPVKNTASGLVEITLQNHGYSVDADSVDGKLAEISHINLNDHSVEGLKYKNFNGFSVQFHPEASPGPHDSAYLFDEFIAMISKAGT